MKRIVLCILVLALSSALIWAVDPPATPDAKTAKDLVEKGLAFYKTKGKDAFLAEVTKVDGQFKSGEFYLFVIEYSGLTLAHGGNAALVGKNNMELKDPDGLFFTKEFIKVAKAGKEGWVLYRWPNPVSKKVEKKYTFVKVIPGTELIVGCGFYENP